MAKTGKSEELFKEAKLVMPGGVTTPTRSFAAVGGVPRFIIKGKGSRITDTDGNEYIDYVCSWGAAILGHADPTVVKAIRNQAALGTSYGLSTPGEIAVARLVMARMPSIEKIRFVNSGTEAVLSAIRLARAVKGRPLILKFEGNYHGQVDDLLVESGSGIAALGIGDKMNKNIVAGLRTVVAPYNDSAAVRRLFEENSGRIAAIIVEPVATNMGVVPPEPGFLQALREIATTNGSLLIFDEVVTGFRVSYGGAQEYYGVVPDLTVMGKAIGGGLPIGAYGGAGRLMDALAPIGSVYQGGTFSGNPLTMAAAQTLLSQLRKTDYQKLEAKAASLQKGLQAVLSEMSIDGTVQRVGSLLTIFFGLETVKNFSDASKTDKNKFASFFHAMLKRGIHLPPSHLETWFVSISHTENDISKTLKCAKEALKECAEGR